MGQTVLLPEQCLRDGYSGAATILQTLFEIFLSLFETRFVPSLNEAGYGTRSDAPATPATPAAPAAASEAPATPATPASAGARASILEDTDTMQHVSESIMSLSARWEIKHFGAAEFRSHAEDWGRATPLCTLYIRVLIHRFRPGSPCSSV